jgi:hypothetical protein
VLGQHFGGAASLFGGFGKSTATAMAKATCGGLADLLKYTSLFTAFAEGGFTGAARSTSRPASRTKASTC